MLTQADSQKTALLQEEGHFQTALAQTATRAIALYFSRPVRLFRPSKISGWQSLKAHAAQQKATLNSDYVFSLIKKQGFWVIPKHFIPPMAINAFLGTVLWTTFAETHQFARHHLSDQPVLTAALSGSVAGAFQALVAAPAENVRLLMEGGSGQNSWSSAWKEVFRCTIPGTLSGQQKIEEIRLVRTWMKEVGSMTGRGWNGWGWCCAKDACGFAAFFSVFEVSRRVALVTKNYIETSKTFYFFPSNSNVRKMIAPLINGAVLVTGGVIAGLSYELVCRPWDAARRLIILDKVVSSSGQRITSLKTSPMAILSRSLQNDGILFFLRGPYSYQHYSSRSRISYIYRTMGRVGPWGVAFLVWEMCSSTSTGNI